MLLLLFWMRVFFHRLYSVIKQSPVIMVALFLVIVSLIVSNTRISFILTREHFNIVVFTAFFIRSGV
jgi:hypothetical protein